MFEPEIKVFDICEEHSERNKYDEVLDNKFYNMLKRCYDEKNKMHYRYAQRGIKVCDEWKNDKRVFFKWCRENGYDKDLEIDRIDSDKGYEPTNCRFITRTENRRNREDYKRNKR